MGTDCVVPETVQSAAASALRWPGSKTQLLPALLARLPSDVLTRPWVVPFLGGGALTYELGRQGHQGHALLADLNPCLVALHQVLRDDCDGLLALLEAAPSLTREAYDVAGEVVTRAHQGEQLETLVAAVALLTVSRGGYSGLFRVSQSGRFNVALDPGKLGVPLLVQGQPEKFRACSAALQAMRADIRCAPWQETLACVYMGARPVLLADPPYFDSVPADSPLDLFGAPAERKPSFTGYTAQGFGLPEQIDLARALSDAADRGAFVITTNAENPDCRKLYAGLGFTVEVVGATRSINSDGAGRGEVGELLMTKGS